MFDVIVIGAGPSGALASALLVNKGYRVLVLERESFPRFSIGESLLPHCMEFVAEAGMTAAVEAAGFQRKNGAAFRYQQAYTEFDFRKKFSPGPGETFQVKRAQFDKILADEAAKAGADIRYQHQITAVDIASSPCRVMCTGPEGEEREFQASFLLDASGFGRVLPRLLDLERPSEFPVRSSLFAHIADGISPTAPGFDREKILITVHPQHRDLWFWLIPFSDGRSSIGAVGEPALLEQYPGDAAAKLQALVAEDDNLRRLLVDAQWDTPVRQITGYSADVTSLAGDNWALLGNAGEFLDPVFSSGVTIAMRSASQAVQVLQRQLEGETVDWQRDYAIPLRKGVDTFRAFVDGWYDGRFQDVIFFEQKSTEIAEMIASILAGYAWDENNPYVAAPQRRLNTLWRFCQQQSA